VRREVIRDLGDLYRRSGIPVNALEAGMFDLPQERGRTSICVTFSIRIMSAFCIALSATAFSGVASAGPDQHGEGLDHSYAGADGTSILPPYRGHYRHYRHYRRYGYSPYTVPLEQWSAPQPMS